MADKKIINGVMLSGRMFAPGNVKDAEDLDKFLSPEDAKRLEKQGVIQGFKGAKQEIPKEEDTKLAEALRTRRLTTELDEGDPRPMGIEYKDGEPQREVLAAPEVAEAKPAPKTSAPWKKPAE